MNTKCRPIQILQCENLIIVRSKKVWYVTLVCLFLMAILSSALVQDLPSPPSSSLMVSLVFIYRAPTHTDQALCSCLYIYRELQFFSSLLAIFLLLARKQFLPTEATAQRFSGESLFFPHLHKISVSILFQFAQFWIRA